MNRLLRSLALIALAFAAGSCGKLLKKDAESSDNSIDLAKLQGYWRLNKITLDGGSQYQGREIIADADRYLLVIKDQYISNFNITRGDYAEMICSKDARYYVDGNLVRTLEKQTQDSKPCVSYNIKVVGLTDTTLTTTNLTTINDKTYLVENHFARMSEKDALNLINKPKTTSQQRKPGTR